MRKRFMKLICVLLSLTMLLCVMPISALTTEVGNGTGIGYPTGDYDGLILEFSSAGALEVFKALYGGSALGGNMLLTDGTYSDAVRYEKMAYVESVTYNYIVGADSLETDYGINATERRVTINYNFWKYVAKLGDEAGLSSLYTVRVGVLDTGIDATHEDLKNRTVAGYDAIGDTAIEKGVNSDLGKNGHGTQVAGLIGAEMNNGVGIAGAAGLFPVELVPIRVLDEDGKGKISDVVRGIYWAIENDVDILNMSFGAKMEYYPTALANAIRDAVNQNIFPICAGGNDTSISYRDSYSGYYPADLAGAYPILSGAYNSPSEYSYTKKPGDTPGIDYTATSGYDRYTTQKGGGYDYFTGTSASCAIISGATAAIFSILGGRTNPKSAELSRRAYASLHNVGTELHTYNVNFGSVSWAQYDSKIKDDFINAIKSARITIQGTVECRPTISGNAEITSQISMGKERIGDATLVVYDESGNIIHTSAPFANDGTNPKEYKFTLDTSSFADGAVTMKIFYRTAAQVSAGTDCKTVINYSVATAYIRNSLMVTSMQIFLYDADGKEISAPVTVINPETGKVVATVGSRYYDGVTVDRKLFDSNGGTLKFAYAGEGAIYSKTTTFVPEIEMGGDYAQETVLKFAGDTVTLGGATVYAFVGGEYRGVGTTDASGNITVMMSDGEYTLAVKDSAKGYILHMTATQNGSITQISFADDINAARAFNIAAASKLGAGDFYSVSVSMGEITSTIGGVSLGWVTPEMNTIYLSPINQYMAVNIFDYIAVSDLADRDEYQKYYFTSHIIGEIDVETASGVDFDPASLKTSVKLDKNSIYYGDSASFELNVRDDKGYIVLGGCLMDYSEKMTVPYYTEWREGNMAMSMKNSAGEEMIENEWSEIIQTYEKLVNTAFYGQMLLPVVSDDYTVSMMLSFDTELKNGSYSYTGYLPYSFGEGTAVLHVDAGGMIKLNPIVPDGADSAQCDSEQIYAWINGKAEKLSVFKRYTEIDGKNVRETYINASGLEAGTLIFVPVRAYYYETDGNPLLYPAYFEYDPEKHTVDLTKPDTEFGNFRTKVAGFEKNGTTVEFNIDGKIFSVDKTDSFWIPAGEYYIHAVDRYNGAMYIYRMKLTADENNTQTVIDGTGMKKIDISANLDDLDIQIIPLMAGIMVGENETSGIGSLFDVNGNVSALYIDDNVDRLFADVRDRGADDVPRMTYRIEIPKTADSVAISGKGIDAFSAAPSQTDYTTEQDVIIDLSATMTGNFKLLALSYIQPYDFKLNIEGKTIPYYPVVKYRKAGGEWQTKTFADWASVNLGKLEAGEYEAAVSFAGVSEMSIPARETGTLNFTVTKASAGTHSVKLFAPAAASGDAIITISGAAGAAVTVSYTTPSGATKTLAPVTLPESGSFRLSVPLTETGEYTFTAVSQKAGETDAAAESIKVNSVSSVVAPVTGLSVTNAGSGELKLTWDKHGANVKIWIYRDGEALGYVSSSEISYTDKGLDSARIYTYTLVAENAAGDRSESISAAGRPTEIIDTQKPTAPANLTAQVNGTKVSLKWTRSDDNIRVAGYRVYRNGKLIKDTTKRSFTDSGLARGTEYTYYIKAYDGAGNESDESMSVGITTASEWNIDDLTVILNRNKFGAITGDVLSVHVSASSEIDRAIAEIVYTTLDAPTEEKKETIELGKAGTVWNGTWKFSRIYEIKSLTAITYLGGEEKARKASDEFPCTIASSISIPVTVKNAEYAKIALEKMQIFLKNGDNGTVYTQTVRSDGEMWAYTFEGISAGTYTLTVKYRGETLHTVGGIELLGGVNKVLDGFEIDNFVRFKMPYQSLIYKPTYGYGYRLNDDGYLEDENGDSAFYMYDCVAEGFKYSFERAVGEWYSESADAIRILPKELKITIARGTAEYTLPELSTFEKAESVPVKIKLTSKSGISLAGVIVRLNRDGNTSEALLDENGEVEIAFPATSNATLTVLDIELYDESGNRIAKIPQQTFDFPITAPETTFTQEIEAITGKENVKLKFTSDAPLDGITGILGGKGDNIKFKLDASGEVTLPMMPIYSGGYSVTIYSFVGEGYYIKQQTFSFNGTEYTAEIKAQKAETRKINLRFTDTAGYSVEGVTVRIISDFVTSVFTLGADGRISANIVTSAADSIRIEVSDMRGNIIWENNTFKAKADTEAEQTFEMNSYLKVTTALTKKGNYIYYLFYRDGGELKSVSGYIKSVIEIPSISASGGELFIVPSGSMILSRVSKTVEEQYALIKLLDCIPKITLTRQNVEQVLKINTSDIEYYTITEVKDIVGTKIDSIEVNAYADGKLLFSNLYYGGAIIIPKLKNGQQVIIRQRTDTDINEYLPYVGKYCAEWIIDDIAPHEKNFTFGYQSRYTFKFTDSDGNIKNETPLKVNAFITSSRERYSAIYDCSDGTFALYIRDPLSYKALKVFAMWQADVSQEFEWWYSFWDSSASFRYEIDDITVAKPGVITLSAEYKPVYRLFRITGELVNNIKSAKLQGNGSYYIRMTQSGAKDYESIIELPQGAYDITLDREDQTSREITLEKGINSHSITFRISQEDLEKNYNINAYIITPEGDRSLQYIYELEHEIFSYYMQREISSEEVLFHESGTVNIYDIETMNGAHWGLRRRLTAVTNKGLKFEDEVDLLDPTSYRYYENYSMDDYRSLPYLYYYRGFRSPLEGKWLTFKTPADSFAVSLKVNGKPTYYTVPVSTAAASVSSGGAKRSSMRTSGRLDDIDKENNRIWTAGYTLEGYNLYDKSTGYGYLFIPMPEPESSPYNYDIEIGFRYRDADGNIVTKIYEDSITMHVNAPVLEKWNFEHYGLDGVAKSPTQYVNIRSREDRIAYEESKSSSYQLEWAGTEVFTFNAWFDKPYEVCNVYAIADVPDYCENRVIKLEYDEELGYYTGTGLLGDVLSPPDNYNIVFDYVASQPYNGMPTIQISDIIQNYIYSEKSTKKQDENYITKEVAPENGWSLKETYEKWEGYAKMIKSKEGITEAGIRALLGSEMRLYLPAVEVYEAKSGKYLYTLNNFYDFSGSLKTDESYDTAIMLGDAHIATLTQGIIIDEEANSMTFVVSADDPIFILPEISVDEVQSAGIGAVATAVGAAIKGGAGAAAGAVGKAAKAAAGEAGKAAKSAAESAGKAWEHAKTAGAAAGNKLEKTVNTVGANENFQNGIQAASTISTTRDYINVGSAYNDRIFDKNSWENDLTYDQLKSYNSYRNIDSGMSAITVGLGAIMPVAGVGFTAFDLVMSNTLRPDIEEKYQKMADLNRQMEREAREMEFFRQFGYRPDDDCFPDNPNLVKPTYLIDPSGYIFEGIESNLLEGVTATVYYLDTASGEWVKWDSEAYGEGPNPNISGTDGKYGWDVLIGKWKVVFEKDGYYTVESVELDVPPAHLDVNMSMVSTSAAKLKEAKAGAGGAYIDFTFDKPVLTEDVKRFVSVMFIGEALDGTITALDEAQTTFGNKQKPGENDVTPGLTVATKFRFTPDEPIEIGASVTVKGEQGIMTYNGIEADAFESEYILIPATVADVITALSYPDIEELDIGATLDLRAKLVKTGSEGTITFKALNPAIATVSESGTVTAISGGKAYIMISCGEAKTVAVISVKSAPHSHSFDKKLATESYKASDATCTEAAKYYFLCSCGTVSAETYSYGEPLGHSFGEWELNISTGKCERICSVCGEREENTDTSVINVAGSYIAADGKVKVEISLANNPGIAALLFRVNYPAGALTLENATAGGLFTGKTLNTAEGIFLFDNATDVTENGLLLTLTFKVKKGIKTGDYRIGIEILSCNNASLENVIIIAGMRDIEIEADESTVLGDLNNDGKIDAIDLTLMRKKLASYDVDINEAAADLNNDGKIDVIDLTLLRKKLAGFTAGE